MESIVLNANHITLTVGETKEGLEDMCARIAALTSMTFQEQSSTRAKYLNVMLYILFNLDKKTTTQLSEELDYSRQCISRISKLFREKLLSNPEYFDIDE